ncbi:MAG: class I SAM-dependent methyltransferase [Gemmatales bacterium]
MGIYSKYIFPRLCDCFLNRPNVAKHRELLLQQVSGSILEIGFGTGLNLSWYPRHLQQLSVIEPNTGMHRLAQERIRQSGMRVDVHHVTASQLPFEDCSFDTVVSTFTLCSIQAVDMALSEVYRVLRPSGRFLFLEHGLSPDAHIQKWQRRLNWLQKSFGDGCHLDRHIRELVASKPYASLDVETQYLEKTPVIFGYLYRGVATK